MATFPNVLHGAAEELTAGRLNERAADNVIVATLLAAFTVVKSRDVVYDVVV